MKDDQVVRMVVAVCLVAAYAVHVGLNGGGPVRLLGVGSMKPFAFVATLELILAFPELLDSFPLGPSRS